jgi:Holliday junction resolvase RusA-like endonuclease
MTELTLTIPLTPVSVNHYKKRARNGHWFLTSESTAYKEAIGVIAAGRQVRAKAYELEATVFLGKGQRGDGDNFWKVLADGLVKAGVIDSDAKVTDWIMHVRRDREQPRTEVIVRSLDDVLEAIRG